VSTLLVSDQEREYTVGLLRGHWLTGRLTAEEFEQRVGEAWRARSAQDLWQALRFLPLEAPAPPARARGGRGSAVGALVMGIVAMVLLFGTLGLGFPLALPLFVAAWVVGRDARRTGAPSARGMALAGQTIGVVGTAVCALLLGGLAALFL
jgi:uncharacterized protein DUF1707